MKAGQAPGAVNSQALITCPFSLRAFVFLEVEMDNQHIIVFVDEGPDNIRPSLLLAPEIAASFGWSNGAVISQTEGM